MKRSLGSIIKFLITASPLPESHLLLAHMSVSSNKYDLHNLEVSKNEASKLQWLVCILGKEKKERKGLLCQAIPLKTWESTVTVAKPFLFQIPKAFTVSLIFTHSTRIHVQLGWVKAKCCYLVTDWWHLLPCLVLEQLARLLPLNKVYVSWGLEPWHIFT